MSEKILACPFQCVTLKAVSVETENGKEYYVECDCGARGPIAYSSNRAIEMWNAAANALAAKDAEIAEHRRHVATVMKRESEEAKAKQYYYDELQNEKTRTAIAKAEIARLTAALADTEEQRHETVGKLRLALIREANGDARQDKLEAEIARLDAALIQCEGALADAQDKRDRYYADWYAEHCRVEAGKRRQDELEAEIAHLTAACDDLEGEYLRVKEQRDEARKVARVWYNAAGVWKERYEASDIDAIEDELMQYCQPKSVEKFTVTIFPGDVNPIEPQKQCTCGSTAGCPIHGVQGYEPSSTARTEPQPIRVETTDKETP